MTIFQIRATVKKIFRQTRWATVRDLHTKSEKRVQCIVWLAYVIWVIGIFTVLMVMPNTLLYGLAGFSLTLIIFTLVRSWALRRHFQNYYRKYAISESGFLESQMILHYALFVEHLEDSQLTKEEITKISEWFKNAELPPRQDTFFRYTVGALTLAVLVFLFQELIKKSETLKQPHDIMVLIVQIIGYTIAGYSIYNFPFAYRRDTQGRLQQFLTWYLTEKNEIPQ